MINIGNNSYGIREAYEYCNGVLECKGKFGGSFEVIDFKREFGEDGSAYFVQRLLYDAHNPGTISRSQDGSLITLTKF